MNYMDEIVTPELTRDELDFIVDNALNGLWVHCMEKLKQPHLGIIEEQQLEKCRDKAKCIMKKLDPTLF